MQEPLPEVDPLPPSGVRSRSPGERGDAAARDAAPERVTGEPGSDWSLAGIAARRARPHGAATMAIVDRLAGGDPPLRPAAPQPPPEIAGLADLVEVGRGGMGVVYRARETRLGRVVAVKVLSTATALSPDGRRRAEREADALRRIAHPNIVQIHYLTDVAGMPAIVMEWIDGPALDVFVGEGSMPMHEAVAIVADLARGVAAVHAGGIIHRDIKPANVLLAPPTGGGRPIPKLIDFGLARPDGDTGPALTRASVAVGTPSFMAPEQTGLDPSLGPAGAPTDIHGLGGILYWLLSGRAPHDGRTAAESLLRAVKGEPPPLASHVVRLPDDLGTIVGKCLERRPERRYRSAGELVDDLERFLDRRPIFARPAGPLERLLKWARRRPAIAALTACSAVAVLALVAGVAYHVHSLRAANVAVTASRDKAIAAQALARRSFDRLTDATAERFLARGEALDDADRQHLRRIGEQYRNWELDPDIADGLRFRAAGHQRLSRIFSRLHWTDDALEAVRAAIASLDELAARGSMTVEDEATRLTLLRSERGLLAVLGRTEEAMANARDVIERLTAHASDAPCFGSHLALAWSDLGTVESQIGRHDDALEHQGLGVELFDRMLAEAPDDTGLLELSLPVLYNAAISPSLRDEAGQRVHLEKLVARSEAGLSRGDGDRREIGRGALLGWTALAMLDMRQDRPTEAIEKIGRRSELAESLSAEMPESDHFRGEVIAAACQASRCLAALGRPGAAEADLAEAVELATQAVTDEPAVFARTRVLAEAIEAQAAMFSATGRPDRAKEANRRLLAALAPWTDGPRAVEEMRVAAERVKAAIERLDCAAKPGRSDEASEKTASPAAAARKPSPSAD